MDISSLPQGVFCLTLSHNINDVDAVERYLEEHTVETEQCIPTALRNALSPTVEALGLPPMPFLSAQKTLQYLQLLWNVYMTSVPKLHIAITDGLDYLIPYLYPAALTEMKMQQYRGQHPLAVAAEKDNLMAVRILLALGAAQTAKTEALIRAVSKEYCDINVVQELLKPTHTPSGIIIPGADIHTQDETILYSASMFGCDDVVRLLLSMGANIHAREGGALRAAASANEVRTMKTLLEAKADVHAKQDGALTEAALYGKAYAVKFLIDSGANVNANNGLPLLHAVEPGDNDLEIVRMLLAARADVHAQEDAPLYRSAMVGSSDVVRALLEANANINVVYEADTNFEPDTLAVLREYGYDG